MVVYQAYKPAIGKYALQQQRLGGPDFSLSRTSWVKPNFTWMAHRCGWASKPGQEVVLAIHVTRTFWDSLLEAAVHSSYQPHVFPSQSEWHQRLRESQVVMQWDPDHAPFTGARQPWRCLQLGLRGSALTALTLAAGDGGGAVVRIEDVSDYMRHLASQQPLDVWLPAERQYEVAVASVRAKLEL